MIANTFPEASQSAVSRRLAEPLPPWPGNRARVCFAGALRGSVKRNQLIPAGVQLASSAESCRGLQSAAFKAAAGASAAPRRRRGAAPAALVSHAPALWFPRAGFGCCGGGVGRALWGSSASPRPSQPALSCVPPAPAQPGASAALAQVHPPFRRADPGGRAAADQAGRSCRGAEAGDR